MIQPIELAKHRLFMADRDRFAVTVRAWKIAFRRDVKRPADKRRNLGSLDAFRLWSCRYSRRLFNSTYERDHVGNICSVRGDLWIVWAQISAEHKAANPDARSW